MASGRASSLKEICFKKTVITIAVKMSVYGSRSIRLATLPVYIAKIGRNPVNDETEFPSL